MYKRNLYHKLIESIEESPVVLINGARQTGKSTLVKALLKETHQYYTLDDYSILSSIQLDPYNFLASQQKPIILDEIQRAPEAFVALKRIVDENRTPGRFVLTGSANILMLPKLADSLAGRMEILTLWPLSTSELYDTSSQIVSDLFSDEFLNYSPPSTVDDSEYLSNILMGGYPEVVRRSTVSKRNNWFKGYIQTLLTRDVQDISGIERTAQLPTLLNILATRIGGLLNASELSRSSRIPLTTLNRYLKIFEMLYLTTFLQPWHANIGKRFVKSPKLYLSDVGLLSFLLGVNEEHLRQRPDIWGHIFENFIVMELVKHQTWAKVPFQIYHYRTENNEEIDLILETDQGDLIAIEIKTSKTIDGRSLKAIKSLQATMPNKVIKGFVVYTGDKVIPLSHNIWALPLSYFMQQRSKHYMIEQLYKQYSQLRHQYQNNHESMLTQITLNKKRDEMIPDYVIESSELLTIAVGYKDIIRQIQESEITNKDNLVQELEYIGKLLPDRSKSKPSNAPVNRNIPVENIGIFVQTIKKTHKELDGYFNKNLSVPPKNPLGFQI